MKRLMARNAAQTGRVKNTEILIEMLSALRKLVSMIPGRDHGEEQGAAKRALVMM